VPPPPAWHCGALLTPDLQIDPFGHSATQASLLSSPSAGFGGVLWARIDYQDRANRVANATMEYAWQPSDSLGEGATTFGSTFRFHYSAPGACRRP